MKNLWISLNFIQKNQKIPVTYTFDGKTDV